MIDISRSLLRQVRSLFRKAGIGKMPGVGQPLQIAAGYDGLFIRGQTADRAIEFHQPDELRPESLLLPAQFLDDCEGRQGTVTLDNGDQDRPTASWTERGVPQLVSYSLESRADSWSFPDEPTNWRENSAELLAGLRAAAATTESASGRYALDCLELRGDSGTITATDGRQAYWHGGLSFPWTESLLLPVSAVWRSSELTELADWRIGQTGDWIVLRSGSWTLWQRVNRDGRFPRLDEVLPKGEPTARLELDAVDADFLAQALCKLPCHDPDNRPLTIDLNGHVALRAKDTEGRTTEVRLARSRYSGAALAISTNRNYFERAVQRGLHQLAVHGDENIAVASNGCRKLLWMLLARNDLVAAQPGMTCLSTDSHASSVSDGLQRRPTPSPIATQPRRHQTVSSTPHRIADRPVPAAGAATTEGQATASTGGGSSPIQQTTLLLASLNEAARNTRELIRTLRRQRKQSQLVQSTLASLKQLKEVA
ncbi:MAG: hypothetical protein AB7O62_15155 [Pirellulales bacterium]